MKKNLSAKRVFSAAAAAVLTASLLTALTAQVYAGENNISASDNAPNGILSVTAAAPTDEIVDAGKEMRAFKYEISPDKPYVSDFLIKPGINSDNDSAYIINLLYEAFDIPKSHFDADKNAVVTSDLTYKYLLQNK